MSAVPVFGKPQAPSPVSDFVAIGTAFGGRRVNLAAALEGVDSRVK